VTKKNDSPQTDELCVGDFAVEASLRGLRLK
jgi:hypothetical protein